jgi:potassium intermediate/small conductance calcium-activated channel subfamily N protein 2
MNKFKVTQRLYRSIKDTGSLNEEMTREFTLIRSEFKDLMDKQQLMVESNNEIMKFLNIETKQLEGSKYLTKSS